MEEQARLFDQLLVAFSILPIPCHTTTNALIDESGQSAVITLKCLSLFGRVGTVLEMIKVVVVAFQSTLRALSALGRIENTGFRTL
jgi:hypothetical protein